MNPDDPRSSRPSLTLRRTLRDLALLLGVVVACAVPFLDQPFHMDDGFYLDMARNVPGSPLFPNDTPYTFEGQRMEDMGSHSHPPLQTYFLASIQRLFGGEEGRERIYHAAALLYPILAVSAFYLLAARMLSAPLWPALVLACSPLFLVMQHTLMSDLPAMAFWLSAIASFAWAGALNSRALYWTSSAFQFGAMFTSYQSVALTPLLSFYHLRKGGGRDGWYSLLVPPSAIGAWLTVNYFHYQRWLPVDTVRFVADRDAWSLEKLSVKLAAVVQYQGWLIVFPVVVFLVLATRRRIGLAVLAAPAVAWVAQAALPHYRLVDKLVFTVGILAGVMIVLHVGSITHRSITGTHRHSRSATIDEQFIGVWYFGILLSCLVLFTDGSARYILPLVPAVLVCLARQEQILQERGCRAYATPRARGLTRGCILLVTLAWGLALSDADAQLARIYPRAAREIGPVVRGMRAYGTGEWGFRHYLRREGVRELDTGRTQVRGGDWLVRPRLANPYDVPGAWLSWTVPVQTLSYSVETPLRTLDWRNPAGFYSTHWGKIPFTLSAGALEQIEVGQLHYLLAELSRATIESSSPQGPWQAFIIIEGRKVPALLVKPGTRILYPWTAGDATVLEVRCGLSPEARAEGIDREYRMGIAQLDDRGEVISSFEGSFKPSSEGTEPEWRRVRIPMLGRMQGGEFLEVRHDSGDDHGALGSAVFAAALLLPDDERSPRH